MRKKSSVFVLILIQVLLLLTVFLFFEKTAKKQISQFIITKNGGQCCTVTDPASVQLLLELSSAFTPSDLAFPSVKGWSYLLKGCDSNGKLICSYTLCSSPDPDLSVCLEQFFSFPSETEQP